ncbi:DUF3570 domain-containing protein [bacterium]|mgnify:CR=1 FL=1|nr:DUF3570 domain-containing protein [bacterium]
MQLILLLFTLAFIFDYAEVLGEQSLSVHSMGYSDSDDISIWEGFVLYKKDLSDSTNLSIQYGIDSVTSASFNAISETTPSVQSASLRSSTIQEATLQIRDDDEDENEEHDDDHDENNENTSQALAKLRHSASISMEHNYTNEISGVTSIQGSSKSDYVSYTLGQTISMPILDNLTTFGLGAYYTQNTNTPHIPTTNLDLLPPQGESLNSNQMTSILSIERIISNKSRIKVLAEAYNQTGYLSTGYQRVPIENGTLSGDALEVLPNERTGVALTAIYSQWLLKNSAGHIRARYAKDSYGMIGLSGDLTLLTYLSDAIIGEIRYRYYHQTSADFYGQSFNSLPSGFFSNHRSLSEFTAYMIGGALTFDIGSWGSANVSADLYQTDKGLSFGTVSLGFTHLF